MLLTALFAFGTALELGGLILLNNYMDTVSILNEIMLTFLIGIVLGRSYGKEYFEKMQWHLKSKTLPADDVLNGAIMAIASTLLITPGIITDMIGFLIAIPLTRSIFKEIALNFFRKKTNRGELYYFFKD
ncbi:MAG: FxsA family protein [Candidatus Nitrohelix vancouverensis]|uniref:FxsA family protein n=1 Tax=Candidatus Nitrohelix vancouverensis TaxID=2705534 RepID=A0A7T0C3A0_9BACT|nr:MAG: FxsA family protein [Candidatus Nitrohelix vancouverensis]